MFLRDPSAPATCIFMSKRLWLAYACKRIGGDCLHEFQRLQRCLTVTFDPPSEVGAEFRMENRDASRRPACSCPMLSHLVPYHDVLTLNLFF
jgi:hypothetical protein